MGSFPEIIFGRCPRCGGNGGDDPSPSSADSSSNLDTEGNGIELIKFRGEIMCEICKNRILADEESTRHAEKCRDEETFRTKAGFKKTIT